jgi:AcrR family transcriptional regulator
MPVKRIYSKEAILYAAVEVIRNRGFRDLSARTIAENLKCSTMPIYSYLKSMHDIILELQAKVIDIMVDYQVRKYTDNILLNIGIGYIVFAREEKQLFRFLFIEREMDLEWENLDEMDYLQNKVMQRLGISSQDKMLPDLPDEIFRSMARKTWIFVHGLAFMVNGGMFKNLTDAEIISLVEENASAIYQWETRNHIKGNSSENNL